MADIPAVELRDVRKSFPGGVKAVDGLSLAIAPGRIVASSASSADCSGSCRVRFIQAYTSQSSGAPAPELPGLADLTVREHEVLRLIATGLNNSEIAGALQLSPLLLFACAALVYAQATVDPRKQRIVFPNFQQ